MYSLVDQCVLNGHTWSCESFANLGHMYQEKRIVYKRYQSIPMLTAKFDMNENSFTRHTVKWKELKTRSGARRIAQKSTPYLVPVLSPKTFGFRYEAKGRLFQKLVDRNASLPDSKWPPLYRPQAILRPISHPTIGQQPPSQPQTAEPDSTPAGPSNDPMPTAGPSELTLRAQVPTNYRFAAAPVEIFQTLGGNPRLAVYSSGAGFLYSPRATHACALTLAWGRPSPSLT